MATGCYVLSVQMADENATKISSEIQDDRKVMLEVLNKLRKKVWPKSGEYYGIMRKELEMES